MRRKTRQIRGGRAYSNARAAAWLRQRAIMYIAKRIIRKSETCRSHFGRVFAVLHTNLSNCRDDDSRPRADVRDKRGRRRASITRARRVHHACVMDRYRMMLSRWKKEKKQSVCMHVDRRVRASRNPSLSAPGSFRTSSCAHNLLPTHPRRSRFLRRHLPFRFFLAADVIPVFPASFLAHPEIVLFLLFVRRSSTRPLLPVRYIRGTWRLQLCATHRLRAEEKRYMKSGE